jgi:hypothetical protein
MNIELWDDDLRPEYSNVPLQSLRLKHFNDDVQKIVRQVGRAIYYQQGRRRHTAIYPSPEPERKSAAGRHQPRVLQTTDIFVRRHQNNMELGEVIEGDKVRLGINRPLSAGTVIYFAVYFKVAGGECCLQSRDVYTLQQGDVISTPRSFTYNGEQLQYHTHVFGSRCPLWLQKTSIRPKQD